MEIARSENVSPTEALLSLVRTAVGHAAYVDSVLVEIMRSHVEEGGNPLDPPDVVKPWLKESRQERLLAARTAKAAIDAGVMIALTQRMDLEGTLVADAVSAALDSLGLDTDQRTKALSAAHARLLGSE